MAKFEKGTPRPNGAGRKAGTPNKINSDLKDIMAEIIISNATNLKAWFEETAQKDPAKALALHIKMCEFFVPRADKKDVESIHSTFPTEISVVLVRPKDRE
jgi:hypothetical protein